MDYSALTHIPLFGQITPDELEGIFNELNIHENSFKKGEILALQDEPANRLIILLKGSVKAEMTDPSGKVVKVEDIEAPNPLAVLFLFGRDNRFPVQATAREHVEAVVIPKRSILKMLSMNETILKNYLDISADFASRLSRKLHFMSFRTIRQKSPPCTGCTSLKYPARRRSNWTRRKPLWPNISGCRALRSNGR